MELIKIEAYCSNKLNTIDQLPYHNINLIQNKIDFLRELGARNKKINENLDLLVAAIWIDVTAYAIDPLNHSKKLIECLDKLGEVISKELRVLLMEFINKSKEGILSEFNLIYGFSVDSVENLKNKRKEKIKLFGKKFSDGKWITEQFRMLEAAQSSSLTLGEDELSEHELAKMELKKMRTYYQKALEKEAAKELYLDKEELKQLTKKLSKVEGVPERGIESWFRLASRNLYTRLQIVDTKAGMLITANSLIISIVLGSLYTHLDEDPHLIFAVAPLIITCSISITFAILAAIPKINKVVNHASSAKLNLMTFDDFEGLTHSEYNNQVKEIMGSGEVLYNSITTNIYELGQKLAKKYKLIRVSFLVLLYGIILSIIMFGICHLIGI